MVAFRALLICLAAVPAAAQGRDSRRVLAEIGTHHIEARSAGSLIRRDKPALAPAEAETTSTAYANAVRASHPVAYWQLDDRTGDKADSWGPACGQAGGVDFGDVCEVAGQIHGSPTLGAEGLIPTNSQDKAFKFSGATDEEIVIPDNEYINVNESGYFERTVELWFKAGDLGAINRSVFEEGNAAHSGLSIYARSAGAGAELFMYGWDRGNEDGAGEFGNALINPKPVRCTIETGKAYYAALVFNAHNRTLTGFIRRPGSTTVDICGQMANMPTHARLRHHGHGGGNAIIGGVQGDTRTTGTSTMHGDSHNFVGTVDEVAVYNRALPKSELQTHADAAGTPPAPAPPPAAAEAAAGDAGAAGGNP